MNKSLQLGCYVVAIPILCLIGLIFGFAAVAYYVYKPDENSPSLRQKIKESIRHADFSEAIKAPDRFGEFPLQE